MHLDLCPRNSSALARLLRDKTDGDRYPLMLRIRTLQAILYKIDPPPIREEPPPLRVYMHRRERNRASVEAADSRRLSDSRRTTQLAEH